MPAPTYILGDTAYCAKQDVQGIAGQFEIPSGVSDDEVNAQILRASQAIDSFTGQHFGKTKMTMLLDGSGTDLLRTTQRTNWRLVSVDTVRSRESHEDEFTAANQVASNAFVISASRKALQRIDKEKWCRGLSNWQLVAYFGRQNIPENIKAIAALLAREFITPGSLHIYDTFKRERSQDGYEYERFQPNAPTPAGARTTGFDQIDKMLSAYVAGKLLMVVPARSC